MAQKCNYGARIYTVPRQGNQLVWYTSKETGEVILDGRGSTEFGGGLNYGAGPDGSMRRSGKTTHLTIPSGSVYVFPGSVVEHSVGEVTVPVIVRWSSVVFWNLRKKVDGIETKAALNQWWNSHNRGYVPERTPYSATSAKPDLFTSLASLSTRGTWRASAGPSDCPMKLKIQQAKKCFCRSSRTSHIYWCWRGSNLSIQEERQI